MVERTETISGKAEVDSLPEEVRNLPITPIHGIAGIALTMAMKYHDISTIQDGTLYQQLKLEGRNIGTLHLNMVFETAEKIERWMLNSSNRIATLLVLMEQQLDEEGEQSEEQRLDDGPTEAQKPETPG